MIRPHHLLRHIGRGKVTFRGLMLRISSKLISCKLTAVIRTGSFNVRVILSLSTRGICRADIIPTSSQEKSGSKATNVRMDFFTKTCAC